MVFAGWQIDTYLQTGSGNFIKLNGVQRVTYKYEQDAKALEECGTRFTNVVEGQYTLTCSIERFYTGSGLWPMVIKGEAGVDYATIQIWPNKSGSGKDFIQLNGVKLNQYNPSYRPGASLMTETLEFIGTGSLTTGTAS